MRTWGAAAGAAFLAATAAVAAIDLGSVAHGADLAWPSGAKLKWGSDWYYPGGEHLLWGKDLYYPSGGHLKWGKDLYYPGGEHLKWGKSWYAPGGGEFPEETTGLLVDFAAPPVQIVAWRATPASAVAVLVVVETPDYRLEYAAEAKDHGGRLFVMGRWHGLVGEPRVVDRVMAGAVHAPVVDPYAPKGPPGIPGWKVAPPGHPGPRPPAFPPPPGPPPVPADPMAGLAAKGKGPLLLCGRTLETFRWERDGHTLAALMRDGALLRAQGCALDRVDTDPIAFAVHRDMVSWVDRDRRAWLLVDRTIYLLAGRATGVRAVPDGVWVGLAGKGAASVTLREPALSGDMLRGIDEPAGREIWLRPARTL